MKQTFLPLLGWSTGQKRSEHCQSIDDMAESGENADVAPARKIDNTDRRE